MAAETRLSKGDYVTVRWRDVHGTFDAADVRIAEIMKTSVQSVDASQIWVPIEALRKMIQAPGEATIIVLEKKINYIPDADENWNYHDPHFLLKDIKEFIRAKSAGASIFYVLLLLMALLAIFDTQVLSVFRRRREIGTLMAMGLARSRVIGLFTVEGALHGIMAFALGALYGVPLLMFSAVKGFALPRIIDKTGFALSEKLYPSYGTGLVIGTTIIVMITVTIVSFLPTRKISDLKPTEALRGKTL
jgi:ABC-type lipoprotein release transport system permease subunit